MLSWSSQSSGAHTRSPSASHAAEHAQQRENNLQNGGARGPRGARFASHGTDSLTCPSVQVRAVTAVHVRRPPANVASRMAWAASTPIVATAMSFSVLSAEAYHTAEPSAGKGWVPLGSKSTLRIQLERSVKGLELPQAHQRTARSAPPPPAHPHAPHSHLITLVWGSVPACTHQQRG